MPRRRQISAGREFDLKLHTLINHELSIEGCMTFPDFKCLTPGQNNSKFNRDTCFHVCPIFKPQTFTATGFKNFLFTTQSCCAKQLAEIMHLLFVSPAPVGSGIAGFKFTASFPQCRGIAELLISCPNWPL